MVDTRIAKNREELTDIMNYEHNCSLLSSINQDICGMELKITHLNAQLNRLHREKSRVEKSISKYHIKYNNDPNFNRLDNYVKEK